MKLRLNDSPAYKYRRRAVFLFALAIVWLPYAASISFAYPEWWPALVFAIITAVGVSLPAALMGFHYRNLSRDEFAKLQPMVGVVLPKDK